MVTTWTALAPSRVGKSCRPRPFRHGVGVDRTGDQVTDHDHQVTRPMTPDPEFLKSMEQKWCRCIPDYSERNLYDPRCSWHDQGEDIVDDTIAWLLSGRTSVGNVGSG